MKLTKRTCITAAVLAGVAATAAVSVPAGSAEAPGGTTLSFYEPDSQSTFKVVDNPPRTFGARPGPRSRFSTGDTITISSALYDRKGGTRQGRLYADATVVRGGTFNTATIVAAGSYVLNDGSQIAVQGYLGFSKDSTFSVVGGTGRYEGASGHLTSHESETSSTDTLTLLP